MTRIKICGLTRAQDVASAIDLGADAVGFVLEPTSPRCISIQEAEALAQAAGPYCTTVAVYGRTGDVLPRVQAIQAVRFSARTDKTKILAVRLKTETTVEDVLAAAEHADAVLLDAYSASAYGGTGERVDWHQAADIVQALKVPVILAGGLKPSNIAEAIAIVQPYGVDVSSGIESAPGIKDASMMRAFIQKVRSVA